MAKKRANGEDSLRKRSDGRWEGCYTAGHDPESGKVIYKNVLVKTQKECKEKLAAALEQAGKVDAHKTDQFTVGQWAEMWFENYAKPSIRETTAAYYKNYIDKHIVPNIGKIKLNKLTTLDIQKLYIVIVVGVIMSKTSIGRKVYAAGDNPEAARLAGLNVRRIKILVFTFAGLLVGISAILMSARAGSADSGTGIEFTGITACVLAGVALKGGEGTLWKVIVAVFVLGVLSNGMQLIGLGTYPQYIAKGAIMLLSLYLSNRNAKAM